MKKLLVLAMMATLLTAGSAFAVERHFGATPNATFVFGNPGAAFGPTTTNNDDSCDIGTAPAATLLLPYFEVSPTQGGQTTLFTITNVTRFPQIAHVTLWTDYSFPVLDFNIFLTGYDVQGINLYDVIFRGIVAPGPTVNGTGFGSANSPRGSLSNGNTGNPNWTTPTAGLGSTVTANGCVGLPGSLPAQLVASVISALTTGSGYAPGGGASCGSTVGGVHANAIGYVTVDVAANCSLKLPTDSTYYTTDMLFDNVFIGDTQQIGPTLAGSATSNLDGAGNPMVHIRAVPEGGGPGSSAALIPPTNLPYTFYDRYTPSGATRTDRRQPLPALWAARYIQGGANAYGTNYKIWREGIDQGACSTVASNNSALVITEIVRFDEHENPNIYLSGGFICSPCAPGGNPGLPETSATSTAASTYPPLAGTDVGGWMYLNLNNGGSSIYSAGGTRGFTPNGLTTNTSTVVRPSQNWVVIEMFGNVGANRLSADFDAAWLGNGCSAAVGSSVAQTGGAAIIGPAGGTFVCPQPLTVTNCPSLITLANGGQGTNITPLP